MRFRDYNRIQRSQPPFADLLHRSIYRSAQATAQPPVWEPTQPRGGACSSNHPLTCWYQNTEFCGFKIQWFSLG